MNKITLMLDSGVFSAWNRGLPDLDINAYMEFIRANKASLFSYVNMDSIPGVFGQKRTPELVRISAKRSYDNLQTMKSHGLKPIAVFHQDEEFTWLERMLKDGETYIGISSGKDGPGDGKKGWLERVFAMCSDSKGKPFIRLHGFGITKPTLLLGFPWYTTDSTTWSVTAAYGKIFIPRPGADGGYDYTVPPVGIAVSGVPNKANNATQFEAETFYKMIDGKTLGLKEAHIRRFIEEECGTTLADLRYTLAGRQRCLLVYFVNVMKHVQDVRPRKPAASFLHTARVVKVTGRAKLEPLRIMFATNAKQHTWSHMMNTIGATTRLLSYFDLQDMEPAKLKEYVDYGFIESKAVRKARGSWDSEAKKNKARLDLVKALQHARGDE